jgi:hypothetical protein
VTITIEYTGALCSAGKTEFALGLMASTPGRYLYAVDRREVIETRITRIDEKAATAGSHPVIRSIFSKSEGKFENGSDNVRRQLREQAAADHDTPHVIVICTHEGLLTSDLSTYDGWTLVIDETPNLWTFREECAEFSWTLFQKFFDLHPVDDEHSKITIRKDAPTVERSKRDTGLSEGFRDLLRRWQVSRPLVNLSSWEEASDGRQWWWCSVWDAARLRAFGRVMILANSFDHSLTYKLLRHQGLNLVPFVINDKREWTPRTILIRYFAEQHQAGTGFWCNRDDDSGAEALNRAFAWIERNTDPENHYYSANLAALKRLDLPGLKLQPKVSGADEYKHLTCATFLYSAKPSKAEVRALELYGIKYNEVVRARQDEDLIQFVWRSSLRVSGDPRGCEFRIYDYAQALFLKNFIEATGRPFTVSLDYVSDAGVDQFKPKPVGAPRKQRSAAEILAARDRRRHDSNEGRKARRERQRQRDIEAGVIRRRGAPSKHDKAKLVR